MSALFDRPTLSRVSSLDLPVSDMILERVKDIFGDLFKTVQSAFVGRRPLPSAVRRKKSKSALDFFQPDEPKIHVRRVSRRERMCYEDMKNRLPLEVNRHIRFDQRRYWIFFFNNYNRDNMYEWNLNLVNYQFHLWVDIGLCQPTSWYVYTWWIEPFLYREFRVVLRHIRLDRLISILRRKFFF